MPGAQLITTGEARRLTGLSTEQLREWTSRRALIPADVKPKGHGSPALYSWQTILLLRLALILRDRFHLELQAHHDLFTDLGRGLRKMSFSSLRGRLIILEGSHGWTFHEQRDCACTGESCIVLVLDPHLEILAMEFSEVQPKCPKQMPLFPPLRIVGDTSEMPRKRSLVANSIQHPVRRIR